MNQLKLHLGCYDRKIYGYTNVDIRSEVNPDVVDDVLELKKFKNNTVDVIYTCHVLEHLSRENSKKALTRWFDLLKPGGILRVSVPDIQAVCEHYIYHKDLNILTAFLWGSQKHEYDFHYMGWDEITLKRDLIQIGFKNPQLYDWRATDHAYIDDYSQAYLPNISYTTRKNGGVINGKLMSLNIEATR